MAILTRPGPLVGIGESEDGAPAEFTIGSLLHAAPIEPLSSGSKHTAET